MVRMTHEGIKIEVIERTRNGISYYTVLLNDWVFLITKNKSLAQKIFRES